MRLLQLETNGEFALTEDLINNIPPYAILSHIWEDDNREIIFKNITKIFSIIKIGYWKIQLCAEQTAHQSLHYIFKWILIALIN